MGNGSKSVKEDRPYRWRSAVASFRPPGRRRSRTPRPMPEQMMLPGMEVETESLQEDEAVDRAGQGPAKADPHAAVPDPHFSPSDLVCPNCGATDFDDDGDCVRCWEPGVVRTDAGDAD